MTAIFFDVDGTLVRWEGEYEAILRTAVERSVGAVEEEWLTHYTERFFHYFGEFARDPYRRAFADGCDQFDIDADPESMSEALVECEFEAVEPVPGVTEVLPALAERHTLGVLTNGVPEVQFGKLERHDLLDYFDVRVASHESGIEATKPDEAIYAAARARVDDDTLVMVGDDREPDIEGARRHGFETVHVNATTDGVSVPDFRTLATLL